MVSKDRVAGSADRKPPRFMPALAWHYLKVMLRQRRRQKLFFTITVGGLALGLAVCLLATLWIWNEVGYDRFHERLDNIAQVYCDFKWAGGREQVWTGSFHPLAGELKAKSPGVLEAARVQIEQGIQIRRGEKIFTNDVVALADSSFFRIFSFPFVRGDSGSAFADRSAVVLSESMARKYFGDEDPLGKTLRVNNAFEAKVTGVIRDVPARSSLRFDAVVPFLLQFAPDFEEPTEWGGNPFQTYVLLRPGTDLPAAASTMTRIASEHFDKDKLAVDFRLLPFSRKHLHEPGAALAPLLRLFALIGLFVLLIACVNFMNLSTARGLARAKEIGIRKAVGGRKADILWQFLGESFVCSLSALALAAGLTLLLLPTFNNVMRSSLSPQSLGNPLVILSALVIAAVAALLGGGYPAMIMARLEPQVHLQATGLSRPRRGILRKSLIVLQFALSAILMIGTMVVERQIAFIKNTDLGYDHHDLISLNLSQTLRDRYDLLRTELLRHSSILAVTAAAQNPGNIGSSVSAVDWEGKDPARTVVFNFDWVGFDYFETLRIPVVSGRSFSREFLADAESGYIVNETAVRMMGLKNPVGQRLSVFREDGRIVGVVKDFHYQPLRSPIGPFVFLFNPKRNGRCFIRISPGSEEDAIRHIETAFRTVAPEEPFQFDFLFLDEQIMRWEYEFEARIQSGARLTAVLSVLIAGIGLFGLAAYLTERRTKEIGVRKVLGASVSRIALALSREFVPLVILANVLAGPVAYLLGRKILGIYAYHIPLGWGIFAGTLGVTLLIAVFAVGVLALRAARRNPVQSLRYE